MKRHKKKEILEALEYNNNVSLVCDKLGVSRQSYYRWYEEDAQFRIDVEKAERMGMRRKQDIADSALMKKVQEGNIAAIKHFDDLYRKPYLRKQMQAESDDMKPRRIERVIFMRHDDPEPTEEQIQRQIEIQDKEKQNENPNVLE